jgi:serine/threonine protein kinase
LQEVYETVNTYFLVLDLLAGGSLNDLIESGYFFQENEIKIIMKGLVEALAYMSLNNIMHRDLKPKNILFKKENDFASVVIADFGIATKVFFYN